MHTPPKIDFPSILAFSVHEMKNSLSTINELVQFFAKQNAMQHNKELSQLEFEANRMNNSLMQLLVLYRIDESKFSPAIDEYLASDILHEVVAQQANLFSMNGIDLQVECPDDLVCYCDINLISNALSTVVNNAQRYTHGKILLSAQMEEDYITFHVEDDGDGYPERFLIPHAMDNTAVNLNTGSTGLGLFFVATIAGMHVSHGKKGLIKLDNNSRLGGAKFTLLLP